jgi:hypothetical protein
MAISPNTDFTSGQILTATQMNQFPRGVMAFTKSTTTDATITAEEVQITSASFTAVANRNYKVTYFEPDPSSTTATSFLGMRLRLTNLAGTLLQTCFSQLPTSGVTNATMTLTWVGTLTAGTTNFVGTLQSGSGTANAGRSADQFAFILVEDIGPA